VLFGNPDRISPALSPDGKRLAFLAPLEGVLNVWVGPADEPPAAKPVTHDRGRGIRSYYWAYTNEHILYVQDREGDENWHFYAVDLATSGVRDLTPFEGVSARCQQLSYKSPREVLLALNNRDPRFHDLWRADVLTGEMTRVQENTSFSEFTTDDDFNLRFAHRQTPDGGFEMLRPTGGGWEHFLKVGLDDSMTTGPAGFDKSGRTLYMTDSRGRDTAALVAMHLDTAEQETLAENPRADVHGVMKHPTEKRIEAVSFYYDRQSWTFLDTRVARDFDYLGTVAEGDLNVVSRTLDDRSWIVAYSADNGPTRYYRYDREGRKAAFLFTSRAALEGLPLAKMRPVVIRSRDGFDLVSYLTLPVWARSKGKPLPMVLNVHGGPWGRDVWGFDASHQWLANRGYAVLSVNFRGSTGFGKNFINAGNLEWAGKMHDDLVDAVRWAVEKGIADPRRVAILGGSYGGYAVLVGMTFTPELFACGVDLVGPSNLVTLLNSVPPYWAPMMEVFTKRVGDHRTEEGRKLLTERSPLTHADRIRRPLLIGQGANDPRVKRAESDQIVAAMQARGTPVTYLLYGDEGHGFARPENRMSFNAVAEAFLAKHLGGRCEPVGEDFQGSSIVAQTGADQVPGLAAALSHK
jgi:dipeptidyl aminopeptidase/acylaminoacyl peptidase